MNISRVCILLCIAPLLPQSETYHYYYSYWVLRIPILILLLFLIQMGTHELRLTTRLIHLLQLFIGLLDLQPIHTFIRHPILE